MGSKIKKSPQREEGKKRFGKNVFGGTENFRTSAERGGMKAAKSAAISYQISLNEKEKLEIEGTTRKRTHGTRKQSA